MDAQVWGLGDVERVAGFGSFGGTQAEVVRCDVGECAPEVGDDFGVAAVVYAEDGVGYLLGGFVGA